MIGVKAESYITQRLREKHDEYVSAWIEQKQSASVLLSLASTLSDLVLWEQELCNNYQRLGHKLTTKDPSENNRCGSGNILIQ
ncbi:MAG: hypothetical protein JKY19_12025 [Alcanivoracaceae bacterium]|nr:hypothetical protein [Alcanivoracaceae bacterium]